MSKNLNFALQMQSTVQFSMSAFIEMAVHDLCMRSMHNKYELSAVWNETNWHISTHRNMRTQQRSRTAKQLNSSRCRMCWRTEMKVSQSLVCIPRKCCCSIEGPVMITAIQQAGSHLPTLMSPIHRRKGTEFRFICHKKPSSFLLVARTQHSNSMNLGCNMHFHNSWPLTTVKSVTVPQMWVNWPK